MNTTNQFKDKKNKHLEQNSFIWENKQISIKSKPSKNVPTRKKTPQEIAKKITQLIEDNYQLFGGLANSFNNILDLLLCWLTRHQEGTEDKYHQIIKRIGFEATKVAAKIHKILFLALYYNQQIYDYLGQVYMNLTHISESIYFSQDLIPFNVALSTVKMVVGDIKRKIEEAKLEKVKVPVGKTCVGSGALFLAYKKLIINEAGIEALDFFSFHGQAEDNTHAKMCKIQMLLTDYRYMNNFLIYVDNEVAKEILKLKEEALNEEYDLFRFIKVTPKYKPVKIKNRLEEEDNPL